MMVAAAAAEKGAATGGAGSRGGNIDRTAAGRGGIDRTSTAAAVSAPDIGEARRGREQEGRGISPAPVAGVIVADVGVSRGGVADARHGHAVGIDDAGGKQGAAGGGEQKEAELGFHGRLL
jgi:hypothetical protein